MEEKEARAYILEHLRKNPRAGDTLEGIARWWLVSQQVDHSLMTVKGAIERLKAEGLIVERRTGDGNPLYVARGEED